jgi:hypothetical protein
MLALLVVVQVFVRRRSNRILNFELVGATVLVLALSMTLLRFAPATARSSVRSHRIRLGRGPVGWILRPRRTTRTWH